MTVRGQLQRLERRHPPCRPRVGLVALDHPPDGRTRAFLDDGTELPPGADWRPFAAGGAYKVIISVDLDAVLGRTKTEDEPGGPRASDGLPS